MATRRSIYYFTEESNFENAKEHLYRLMGSDYGYPKIEFVGFYGGEYRIDIWDECSDAAKAADIIREHKGRFVAP